MSGQISQIRKSHVESKRSDDSGQKNLHVGVCDFGVVTYLSKQICLKQSYFLFTDL